MESLDLNASVKSDVTVSRSSSLIANFKLDEDIDAETKDLFIVVDDPEKHTSTLESYITFRVTTKTNRSEFEGCELSVRRRYNDFLWLRQRLEESYCTHLVPPLPAKHSLKRLDRFSNEFLRIRQAALQKFLTRLADHPVLSFDRNLHVFLTAKAWEFQSHKKQGSGILSRVTDSLHNMGASYMMKNRPPEFVIMHDYTQTFGEKLGVMDRISQRILKEATDYLTEINEWAPCFTLWANSEDNLKPTLLAMSKTVEDCAKELKDMLDCTDDNFAQPLKEYVLYTEAVKGVLRRRDAMQMEYDMIVEELGKKKEEREQLTQQMDMLNDRMVVANADLKADMDRWHINKQRDMKDIFLNMADRNIQYYEKCLEKWEAMVCNIQVKEEKQETSVVTEDGLIVSNST
ncbi:hypothetical protein LOTGIDRAFT_212744 [Lottia gigantea]|uniref:PX domain-containing protein n=1 Tax=Lottia gigantea TaxID=225164 RepID=V4AV63_LOTGI|nr:hypothetical protein LOTGIDRAFT_212744 [Lottia gigantea]ESP01213.1 hypothetical protein LOTGIDRAFT_212744 [Lottia gigantea]